MRKIAARRIGYSFLFVLSACQSQPVDPSETALPFKLNFKLGNQVSRQPNLQISNHIINLEFQKNSRWRQYQFSDQEKARAFLNQLQASIENMLIPDADPYSGEVTLPSTCTKNGLPKAKKTISTKSESIEYPVYINSFYEIDCLSKEKEEAESLILLCDKTIYWILTKRSQTSPAKFSEVAAECF